MLCIVVFLASASFVTAGDHPTVRRHQKQSRTDLQVAVDPRGKVVVEHADTPSALMERARTRLTPEEPTLLQQAIHSNFVESDVGSKERAIAAFCRSKNPILSTMKGGNKLAAVLDMAEHLYTQHIPGDVVEAGVAAGGGVLPVVFFLACTGDLNNRVVHLFDTWEGLKPTADVLDSGFTLGQFKEGFEEFEKSVEVTKQAYIADVLNREHHNNGSAVPSWDEVWNHVRIHKGFFADTMPSALLSSVGLLMCDGDMYSSSRDCLAYSGKLVGSGGIIYNDDYYSFLGNYRAMQEYLEGTTGLGTTMDSLWFAVRGYLSGLTRRSDRGAMLLVPQFGDMKYFAGSSSSCTPPGGNFLGDGQCEQRVCEASLYIVQ